MDPLLKYFPLVKVDEAAHMVWGLVTSETPDSDKEICDYPAAKEAIKKWSDDALAETMRAGQDPSLGNMRVMHQLQIGGKAIKIDYKDDQKQIWVGSEPASDDVWHLLKGGFLKGHSIGGSYAWRKPEGEYKRYGPTIGEISYVDKGSNPDASFAYVKADGSSELRKFAEPGEKEKELLAKLKMAADRDADVARITKSVMAELGTDLEKLRTLAATLVAQIEPTKGETMNPDQIKKCAAALGISEEEFKKQYAAAADLDKAKKGIAALHAHIEKAHSHHEEMHKAHSAMAKMHEAHAGHLGKCLKACKDVMGADEKEADKALKALLDELKPAAAASGEFVSVGKTSDGVEIFKKAEGAAKTEADKLLAAASATGTLSKADVEKLLADQKAENEKATAAAIKKALDEAPAGDAASRARLFAVPRDQEIKKAEEAAQQDPLPV